MDFEDTNNIVWLAFSNATTKAFEAMTGLVYIKTYIMYLISHAPY
jgi:hypothetical protein